VVKYSKCTFKDGFVWMEGYAFYPNRIGINAYKSKLLHESIQKGSSWVRVNKIENIIFERDIVKRLLKGKRKQDVAFEFNVTVNRVTRIFNKWINESIKHHSSFSYYSKKRSSDGAW